MLTTSRFAFVATFNNCSYRGDSMNDAYLNLMISNVRSRHLGILDSRMVINEGR